MKPGDMVKVVRIDHRPIPGLKLYDDWLDRDSACGKFMLGHLGIVVESRSPDGYNGCKVLTQEGAMGWCNVNYLEVVNENG